MNSRNSLLSFLDDATQRGDECAYVQRRGLRKERWTYAQLAATAYQFARELEARGINKGDRVLLWGANGGGWVAAWFGCLARGAVVVPLDETSTPDFIERIQQQVKAKLIVSDNPVDLPALPLSELRKAVSRHSAERYNDETIRPDDFAQIIFTSGTTAEPKGVCLSHRNLLANLAPLEKGIDEYPQWERPFHPLRFLCLLPLSHVFGQFMGIFVPQLLGGEVHFSDSLNPAENDAARVRAMGRVRSAGGARRRNRCASDARLFISLSGVGNASAHVAGANVLVLRADLARDALAVLDAQ